jgi:hypothetical protein
MTPGFVTLSQIAARSPAPDVASNRSSIGGRLRTAADGGARRAHPFVPKPSEIVAADCTRMLCSGGSTVCATRISRGWSRIGRSSTIRGRAHQTSSHRE